MAGIPKFEDRQPILNAKQVSSGAEGYEAFGKVLGQIGEKAGEEAISIQKEQSNAMYLSSVANVDQLKLTMQELMIQDPANSDKHIATFRDSLDKVNQAAYVNKSDRQKLKSYSSKTYNEIELDSVKTQTKQAQIGASYEHYKNWPFQLNALRDATFGDPKKFEQLKDSMLENIKALVMTGSLTPLQGGAAIESMTTAVKLSQDVHELYKDPDKHTAQNYHAAMNNPFDKNKSNNINYPVDEDTKWITNYHSSDRTFQGALDGLYDHHLPDLEVTEKMTPHQRQQMILTKHGITQADSLLTSNASLPKLQSRANQLEGKTDYASKAEKKALKSFVKDINDGNSERLMARTTLGGAIVREYNDKKSFLEKKLQDTDPKNVDEVKNIQSEMARNKNQYANDTIAYGEAHHWPIIHPIPKEDVSMVQSGFKLGGDTQTAYNTFKQYTKQNQAYFADELKNPRQRIVMSTIASGGDKQTDQEKIDFMTANQDGRSYKELDTTTEDHVSDDYLRNKINTKITDAIKLINAQNDINNATILSEQLIGSGINYAKFLSEKKGQYSIKKEGVFNSISNVSDVIKFINQGYEPMSGSNYIVNSKQVGLEKKEMDDVAQYAINNGTAFRKGRMSLSTFEALQNQAPLTVTVTPTNILIAQDAYGNIAYHAPLTNDLVQKALADMKKARIEKYKEDREVFKPIGKKHILLGVEEAVQRLGEKNVK